MTADMVWFPSLKFFSQDSFQAAGQVKALLGSDTKLAVYTDGYILLIYLWKSFIKTMSFQVITKT